MLEKQMEAAWQPAVAPASRWPELLDHPTVAASLFLLSALAKAVVVYPLFSTIWIRSEHKMVEGRPGSVVDCYELLVEQHATA